MKQIIIAAIIFLSIAACKNNDTKRLHQSMTGVMHQKKVTIEYTCPMHHNIREDAPGKCPVCGMTLVPVENNNKMKMPADTIIKLTIPAAQQRLANIHTDTAKLAPLASQVVLTGNIIFNPQQQDIISAWVNGWIEKMYVRNPGEMIHAGEKLYDLYSPDLLSAEKDYVLALQQKNLFKKANVDFTATIDAMKQKLLRWGLTETQIDNLKKNPPSGNVAIFSKTSGYLTQKMKEEGDYVKEGEAIMNIAKNNILWVQAQLYDSELPLLAQDPAIWIETNALPGKKIPGKIVFNNPVNRNDSRVHIINIAIENIENKIQPGMLAYVYLQTENKQPVIVIPKSSVIYDEHQDYVWLQQGDGNFVMRAVQLGADNNSMMQILSGINPGDIVVSHGAYLVNSEYILKYGSGVNMSGMTMSDMQMNGKSK